MERLFCDKAWLVKCTLCTRPIFDQRRSLQDLDPPAFCIAESGIRESSARDGITRVILPTASRDIAVVC
jgi:hypothetical protein